MRLIKLGLLALLVAILTGCASTSSYMKESSTQTLATVPTDKARVVFVRNTFLGSAISAVVTDSTTAQSPVFIGVLQNAKKLAYDVPAGKRVFTVTSESADFLEANLLPGKTYYAFVTPRVGVWKARFSFVAVKATGAGIFGLNTNEFKKALEETRFSEKAPDGDKWFKENLPDILAKQNEYWPKWNGPGKAPAERAAQTLTEGDGI